MENIEGHIAGKRRTLQETMNFMAALAAGMEPVVGRGANGMALAAGRSLGKQFAQGAKRTDNIEEALEEVGRVLKNNDCLWEFETFQPKSAQTLVSKDEDGSDVLQLVFRDCMIRQALFRYGHAQKGSLCFMMYGFFMGALDTIMGRRSELEILHAGENACLKRLTIKI